MISVGPTPDTILIRRPQTHAARSDHPSGDLAAMLENAGIDRAVILDGKSRLTIDQSASLIQELWRATGDELFGLGPKPVPRGTFRLLCLTVLTAGTLQAALTRFSDYGRATPGVPRLSVTTEGALARVSIDTSAITPVDFLVDALLAIWHKFLEWSIGCRIELLRVEVPHPRPWYVDDYEVLFGAPVIFSAPATALIFNEDLLPARIVRSENEFDHILRDAPAGFLTPQNYSVSMSDQVRVLFSEGLNGEWPTLDQVAADLAMSVPTLRRRLREENTTPREIKEAVLRDAAIVSLSRGDEALTALSRRLGFSEVSAFCRAFRRWTGSSPRSFQH